MSTAMYDASQGANSGAHIEVITKSGANAFHGQVYEYRQSDAWNAAQWFRKNNRIFATICRGIIIFSFTYLRKF